MRKVIHIDMDAFYASVEQRDDPALRGKPVAVGFGTIRDVVAAASYEARVFGVRSAMPSLTALNKCPALIFVPPRFAMYRSVSSQVRSILADYTQLIEPLSLDEAYLDVTENLKGLPSATVTAEEIRKRIFDETGLTASAGISYNKFLAKLASDFRKPNGQYVITPEKGPELVAGLPVGKFHGIGPVTTAKMNRLGIITGKDLRERPIEYLVEHFGKSGAWYYEIARGEDHRSVNPNRPRKSTSSETTFAEDLFDHVAIEAGVLSMADDVWDWCETTGVYGRTVTVKIKYGDFVQAMRSRSVDVPIVSLEMFRQLSLDLIRSVYPLRIGIRLVGVMVSNFEAKIEAPELQLDLALAQEKPQSG